MQDYRKLRVWKHSHELVLRVRQATNRFPRTGYASLRTQITDAAESIPCNIVEGCGTDSQAELAPQVEWDQLTTGAIDARRMLCGFRAKVLAWCRKSARKNGKRRNGKREPR